MSYISQGGAGGGGSGTVNAGTANQLAKYPASAAAVSGDSVFTDDGTTATYTGTGGLLSTTSGGLKAGANGGAAGVLSLSGSTSGAATMTAPAVAGTVSNAVISSNALQVGVAGTAGGVLALGGSASGTATFTAPAAAGTLTNPVISSNALQLGVAGTAGGVLGLGGTASGVITLTANSAATAATLSGVFACGNANIAALNATGTITSAGSNGQTAIYGQLSELVTLNTGGTTTDSVANLLPVGAIILGVTARITTTITTAANWSLGDATTAARFMAANSTLTAGTTAIGMQHMQGSVATDAAGMVQTAAAKLRVTTNANPGAGVIRIVVNYVQFVAPTT